MCVEAKANWSKNKNKIKNKKPHAASVWKILASFETKVFFFFFFFFFFFSLICHHTLIWGGSGFEYKILQISPLMASCYEFGVSIHVNELKILIFESFMIIGHYVFLKIDLLGQNWARGRFSRFFARFVSFVIFKCTGVKINPSLTSSRNVSILSAVVCLQCSLEHSFGCHHWIVHKKSSLTVMHLYGSVAGTFKWVLRTNYVW